MSLVRPIQYSAALICLLLTISAQAGDTHAASQPGLQGSVLKLETAIEIAAKNNPGIAEVQSRATAMAQIPSQVGSLPDPMIHLNAMNLPTDTFDLGQENMTQLQVGITQAFPYPGKLGLKEKAAEYMASAAGSKVTETRLMIVQKVKNVWWKLYFLDRALEILARNHALLRQFVDIARTKYKVGQGLQQDVLLAQVELSKLLDREVQLNGKRRGMEAHLNSLMDRSVTNSIILPQKIDEKMPVIIAESELLDMAGENRPIIAAQRSKVNAARSKLKLAKKDYYPDFKLSALYGSRQDTPSGRSRADFASVMLGIRVPLYAARKQKKAVDQRNSELNQQKFALRDLESRVGEQISRFYAEFLRAREQSVLFKTGIIPQARQTVASMLSGYQVGKVDFLNLVRAQLTLYNYETQYWKALSETWQALAKLVAAVGKENIYE
ncbi:MAG TPA: TolC family protein [Gammaproteobacteria bacterium]|nr:TolC family protein [Gammaproteobacteria bacterium]